MRAELPAGTVTFLFTDVEGSTALLHSLGAEGYAEALSSGRIQVRVGLHTGTPLLTEEGYVGGDVHRAARIAASGHGGQVLVSASTATLVETELMDLGQHRFKDLAAPERIYQLGAGDFPGLRSLYRTNLPVPATAFLGRENELAEVLSLLSREDTHLLTLTGPGGTGKTRLALQAAAEISDAFPDGIWWVPLAPLRDPKLVLETAAQVVGSKNGLAEHIADKEMLCLFDNFEQVVEAGAELAELLASCPNLDVLVTSRERLRVRGEQTYSVPPLAEPDGEALFSARARAVDPSFAASAAVGELCARLDELPLALELAAARTALFSPEQLLERLSQRLDLLKGNRDADPRQQTLRATIAWSHDLLLDEEQQLFRRLSVFVGGCTYESAEQVTDADPDTLQSLLDKSLLRKRDTSAGEPRYWMLETIREYATERLDASDEADELRHRHGEHFLALAEEAEPLLRGPSPKDWLDRLEREHDNLRVALDRLEAAGESELALRLAGAVSDFWQIRGHLAEGRRRLERALHADEHPTAARARALNGAADLAIVSGDVATGRLRAEEALALHRTLGDARGTASSNWALGYVAVEEGDLTRGQQLLEESVRGFRELGDKHSTLAVTRTLAWTYQKLGDLEQARALHEDNLRRARALRDEPAQADLLGSLANIAVSQGRVEDALSMLKENHPIYRDLGDLLGIAVNLCRFARALAFAGRAATAAQLLSCFEALRTEIGGSEAWVTRDNEETLAMIRTQLDEAAFAEAWEQGKALTADQAVALVEEVPPGA